MQNTFYFLKKKLFNKTTYLNSLSVMKNLDLLSCDRILRISCGETISILVFEHFKFYVERSNIDKVLFTI